jgi:flagellar basal body rod protein FlgB
VEREGEEKIDRNRVDLDREIGLLIENSLLHEASLTLLSRKLGGLRYAIGEGRR